MKGLCDRAWFITSRRVVEEKMEEPRKDLLSRHHVCAYAIEKRTILFNCLI